MNFKQATLHIPKRMNVKWFVIWYNYNPHTAQLERIRKTFNLNRIKDIRLRKATGYEYCRLINEALQNGYNYFAETPPKVNHANQHSFATIEEGLRYGLKLHAKNLKKRSLNSYRSVVDIFCNWLDENHYSKLSPTQLTTRHVLAFMDDRSNADVSNKTINTNVGYLHKLYSYLEKIEEIEKNPFKVDMLTETESDFYEAFTQDELSRIAAHLKIVHPDFFVFTQFIYFAAIRPYHIPMYQRKQINLKDDIINVFGSTTKNRKSQPKQLLEPLKRAIIDSGRSEIPPGWYLFSTNFKPGEKQITSMSTRATELWYKHVQCELGIKKKMYGLKHTAGQSYLTDNENPDIGWLQRQMEHSSLEQTQTYVAKRTVKKIDIKTLNIAKY